MNTVDLLVLGGGPAGAAAALVAARAGLSVTVLERAFFPRHKPGETLHPGVEPLLERLGMSAALEDLAIVRHRGTWVAWGQAPRFEAFGHDAGGDWLGFQVQRDTFDARLLQAAQDAGVRVEFGAPGWQVLQEGGRVTGARNGLHTWRARWVVDAAGGAHQLARHLGLPIERRSPRLLARYGYVVGTCPARDAAPLLAADSHGWTWTARIAPGLYQWTRVNCHGRVPRAHCPRELATLQPQGPVRGADVTWRTVSPCAGAGYFLAGDAAGVLDPSSSHGVLRALMSGTLVGNLAASVHVGALSESAAAQQYAHYMRDWFAHDCLRLRETWRWAALPTTLDNSFWSTETEKSAVYAPS